MKLAAFAAALGALLIMTGCSGSHAPKSDNSAIPAATVRSADCHAWKTSRPAERQRLVKGMREFFGGQVDSPGTVGKALTDEQAVALFDGYCKQPYADAFELYRIYGNAAAFTRK